MLFGGFFLGTVLVEGSELFAVGVLGVAVGVGCFGATYLVCFGNNSRQTEMARDVGDCLAYRYVYV